MLPRSVILPPRAAEALGSAGDLPVSRIWPRGPGRLSLELQGPGQVLAGQWIDDDGDRRRIAAATARRARAKDHVLAAPALSDRGADAGTVLVQARGADRRLLALPGSMAEPGVRLLVHRPERRAVLALPAPPPATGRRAGAYSGASAGRRHDRGDVYLRVFRPGRTAPVVHAAGVGTDALAGLPGVSAPAVLAHREDEGVVVTSALPGASMRQQPTAIGAAGIGRLLRHLARHPAPPGLPVRDAQAELAWVGVWLDRVGHWLPQVHTRLAPALPVITEHLRGPATAPGIIHGDLHDGQVLVDDDGQIGVLDWDTVALGEGALDAANVWAHAEVRRLLGQWTTAEAAQVWTAVVDHWDPTDAELDRAAAYRRLLLLRLACQYAFRPAQAHVVPELADLAAAR